MNKIKLQSQLIFDKEVEFEKEREQAEELLKFREKNVKLTKKQLDLEKNEKAKLESLRREVNQARECLMSDLSKLEETRLKPYTNKQGKLVHLNANDYEVFNNNPKNLFHRWWAEKQIYNANKGWFLNKYPYFNFRDLEVHHIDSNSRNNDEQNLCIIPWEEHNKIIHKNIPKGNYKAGIKELKRVSIKQPHIKELN